MLLALAAYAALAISIAPQRSAPTPRAARLALCAEPTPTPTPAAASRSERTLGIDFGLARVGIAVSSGYAPLPIAILPCGGGSASDFDAVATSCAMFAAGESASQVLLGMPYNSTGGEGEQAEVTRAFAKVLANAVAPRPLFLWDERFSSAEAKTRMNQGRGGAKGERVDAVAAAVILEDFFAADGLLGAPDARNAIHVPATREPRPAAAPRETAPPPPAQSQVRRDMMERAARQQAAQQQQQQQKRRGPSAKAAAPKPEAAAPKAKAAARPARGPRPTKGGGRAEEERQWNSRWDTT